MRKVLSIAEPSTSVYTHHSYYLSIILNDPNTLWWVFSNYIQMYINKDLNKNFWGDFYFPMPYELKCFETCKWLSVQKTPRFIISERYDDIMVYLKEMLENDYCVHMMVDYYYVSKSRHYMNKHRCHDCFIYGFDDDTQELMCADYMFQDFKLRYETIKYDEIRDAFKSYLTRKDEILYDYIYSYKKKDTCDYAFHIQNVIGNLKDYGSSVMPEYWRNYNYDNSCEIAWGLSCYDVYSDYLRNFNSDIIDLRLLYMFMDHKRIMVDRLNFLQQKSSKVNLSKFIEYYEGLYGKLNKALKLLIKYDITRKEDSKFSVCDILDEVKNDESSCINGLIEELGNFDISGVILE